MRAEPRKDDGKPHHNQAADKVLLFRGETHRADGIAEVADQQIGKVLQPAAERHADLTRLRAVLRCNIALRLRCCLKLRCFLRLLRCGISLRLLHRAGADAVLRKRSVAFGAKTCHNFSSFCFAASAAFVIHIINIYFASVNPFCPPRKKFPLCSERICWYNRGNGRISPCSDHQTGGRRRA